VEVARWLVAFVAFVTAIGGLMADYFIPSSGAQHIKNPRWPPHAKFHNAQSILMGLTLGALSIVLLFQGSHLSKGRLLLSALLASIYWLCIFAAPIFPGTAFSDPEFAAVNPSPMGIPAQLFIGFVLVAILLCSVFLAAFSSTA
jgi:small-conductance mechanosensitive channel